MRDQLPIKLKLIYFRMVKFWTYKDSLGYQLLGTVGY